MKSFLKKILPPFVFKLRDIFHPARMEYVKNGWTLSRSDYNEELLVEKQVKKFRRLVSESYLDNSEQSELEHHELSCAQVSGLRAAWGKSRMRVLDFGGALGVYYHYIKKVLPPDVALEYHITETEKICKLGQKLTPEISFHDHSLPDGHFDLIMLSSTLQYIQDWQALLQKLPPTDYLYLPRTPVTSGHVFTVKDRFGGVSRPIIFEVRNRKEMEKFILNLGYQEVTEFPLPGFPKVKNAPGDIAYANWLFKKIN
ncbi:MAG: methyltransferase, TIGR04325 family [Patescibacteria group bacterium]|nr:methyltransferase, TIGR04325 family [Patescibacteria group bacterium]